MIGLAARAARSRFLSDAILTNAEPWEGEVLRLRQLSADQRIAIGLEPVERRRSQILTWRCLGAGSGQWHWSPEGSRAAGMCLICYTPKPDGV